MPSYSAGWLRRIGRDTLSLGRTSYVRGVVTTSLSQGVVIALSMTTALIQARLLGSEGRGELARFINAGALLVLYLGLGIGSAITYALASGQSQERELLAKLRPAFLTTVAAAAVGVLLVSETPVGRLLPQELPASLVVVSLTVFFALNQASSWIAAAHAASGFFSAINLSALVAAFVAAASSVVLLWSNVSWAGAPAIIGLILVCEALRLLVLLGVKPPAAAFDESRSERSTGELRALWRYSGLSFLADAVQFLTYRLDMWLVDAYHGAADLGTYAVAVSLAQLVWIVPSAAARVLFPFTASMDEDSAAQLAWKAAKVTLLIAGAMALAGWLVSLALLTTVLGEDFVEVPDLLGILLLGIVPFSVAKVLGNFLAGRNALGANLGSAGAVLAGTLALDLLLIPGFGAHGAAAATAVSYCAYTVLLLGIFLHRARGRRREQSREAVTITETGR